MQRTRMESGVGQRVLTQGGTVTTDNVESSRYEIDFNPRNLNLGQAVTVKMRAH